MIYARLYVTGEILAGALDATASFFLTNDGRIFDARSIELLPEGMITGEITATLERPVPQPETFAADCLLAATNLRACHAGHATCCPGNCKDFLITSIPKELPPVVFDEACRWQNAPNGVCEKGHINCPGAKRCEDGELLPF